MILAHTRGLLAPDYPQGIKSWIREQMVLSCLEREVQGQGFLTRSIISAAALPVTEPAAMTRAYVRSMSYVEQAVSLLLGTPYDKWLQERNETSDLEKTGRVFKVLKKTDFYDRMHRTLREALKGMPPVPRR